MTQNFLWWPRTAGEWTADALRAVGVAGVILAAFVFGATDAGIAAFALPALFAPRFVAARPSFDIVAVAAVLVAAWSNVLDLYRTIPGWDLAVHLVATGVLSALGFLALVELGVIPGWRGPDSPRRIPVVLVPMIALAISAVWEMVEWFGFTFLSDQIFVEYVDTIGDMAAGGVGGAIAGFVIGAIELRRRQPER